MLFDIFFFGFPLSFAICLAVVALRESSPKFWHCAFSLFAYCAFYMAGGREVLLYLLSGIFLAGGWLVAPVL